MIDDGKYKYYALKDLATNLYYSGPEEGMLNFEVRPTVDKSGRITKFNTEKAARCAVHEMMYVMGEDIYDDDAYDPASYTIVHVDEALNWAQLAEVEDNTITVTKQKPPEKEKCMNTKFYIIQATKGGVTQYIRDSDAFRLTNDPSDAETFQNYFGTVLVINGLLEEAATQAASAMRGWTFSVVMGELTLSTPFPVILPGKTGVLVRHGDFFLTADVYSPDFPLGGFATAMEFPDIAAAQLAVEGILPEADYPRENLYFEDHRP